MPKKDAQEPWAIILAGGDGTRLQGLTRIIEGDSRPKQFSKIFGRRSLLGHTRERLRPVFSDDRIRFVVTKGHDSFYTAELADVDRSRVLEQPANRGTGVAIIAALLQVWNQEPDAIVGLFPSDHYYTDDQAFAATVQKGIEVSAKHDRSIVLIGAKPHSPEVEYGWIEPGAPVGNGSGKPVFSVNRFCEKPPLNEAHELMKQGGLWNTFVTIGRAAAFLELLSTRVLTAVKVISDALAAGDLDTVYHEMDTIDFSKDVLSLDASNLLVVEDSTSGWADLGNPQRVIETLDRHQIEPDWLCEIRRTNQPRLNARVSSPHQTMPAFRNLVTVQ
jgi:mannose-1-phosphate guanylyltransferase